MPFSPMRPARSGRERPSFATPPAGDGQAPGRARRPMVLIHASCVAVEGKGVLLRGAPGAGKSDLALRLIEGGADLVSDDQVALTSDAAGLLAAPPARIAGLLEVRGVGIVSMAFVPQCPVILVVDLAAPHAIERMPDAGTVELCGHRVAHAQLAPFEASAPAKVRLALSRAATGQSLAGAGSAG